MFFKCLLAICLLFVTPCFSQTQVLQGVFTPGPATNYFLNYNSPISPSGWQIDQSNVPPTSNTEAGPTFCCYTATQFAILQLDKAIATSTYTNGQWDIQIESTGCTNSNTAVCPKFTHPTFPVYYGKVCGVGYSTTALSIGDDEAVYAASVGEPAHNTDAFCTLAWGCGYMDQVDHYGLSEANVYQNRVAGGNVAHDYGLPDFSTITTNSAICIPNTTQFPGENVAVDIVILPPGRLTDIPVLASLPGAAIIDIYEPGDDRSCATTTAYMQTEAAIINDANHLGTAPSYGYGFILNANYMNSNGKGFADGICPNFSPNANSDTILTLLNTFTNSGWYLGLPTASTTPLSDFTTQLGYFNSPVPSKMGIRWWMTYPISAATSVYNYMTSPTQYYGVYLTPAGIPQGCNDYGTIMTAELSGVSLPSLGTC